jgi:hypothetical protein
MTFGDIFWSLIVFYFWFMIIWIFIRIFADIFHRNDLSGVMKVIWIIVLFALPFLGALIYMLMRKPTEQDMQEIAAAQEMQKRAAGFSAAEEITKLQGLLASGAITQAEFDTAKARALA